LSVRERKHMLKVLPRVLLISFWCRQLSQSPAFMPSKARIPRS
jgi:hypothetical protein